MGRVSGLSAGNIIQDFGEFSSYGIHEQCSDTCLLRGIKTVYEIHPASEAPAFSILGTPVDYKSNYALMFTTGCGNLFTFVHGPVIKIWNYVTDEWSTFKVDTNDEIIHQASDCPLTSINSY